MKVQTDVKAGGYVVQAQDQAERFFQKTDQVLRDAGQQLGQAASAAANKVGQVWTCAFKA
jgi:hypothetical protein